MLPVQWGKDLQLAWLPKVWSTLPICCRAQLSERLQTKMARAEDMFEQRAILADEVQRIKRNMAQQEQRMKDVGDKVWPCTAGQTMCCKSCSVRSCHAVCVCLPFDAARHVWTGVVTVVCCVPPSMQVLCPGTLRWHSVPARTPLFFILLTTLHPGRCLQLIEKMQHTGKWKFPPDVLQVRVTASYCTCRHVQEVCC